MITRERLVPDVKMEVAVIGAGAVGLAIARALALEGKEVIVFEKEPNIGQHTSSRNSEVIHSGIYYPKDSLKAIFCAGRRNSDSFVDPSTGGREMLYNYLENKGVFKERIGKLIVATSDSDLEKIQKLKENGEENGVPGLKLLSESEVSEMVPQVRSIGGLFSPSTGIMSVEGYMASLKSDIEKAHGWIQTNFTVLAGEVKDNGIAIQSINQDKIETVLFDKVINSAGLFASKVAESIEGLDLEYVPKTYYAAGQYYELKGPKSESSLSRLVYTPPEAGGLGIHVTLDREHRERFGPDFRWIESIDYNFDYSRKDDFLRSISRYLPDTKEDQLQPGQVGIRPRLSMGGEEDFIIQGSKDHGIDGLVNLYGIESPGLTASLAIAEFVRDLLA